MILFIQMLTLILVLGLNGCGTEIGNGLKPIENPDGGEQASHGAPEAEDAYDEVIPTLTFMEKIANTCASPAGFGALGTYTNEDTSESFTITSPSNGVFSFTYGEAELEAALNLETSAENDITWTNETEPNYICVAKENSTDEMPAYLVSKDMEEFEISWTYEGDSIDSITIDEFTYTIAD